MKSANSSRNVPKDAEVLPTPSKNVMASMPQSPVASVNFSAKPAFRAATAAERLLDATGTEPTIGTAITKWFTPEPVPYTHLTLPTNRIVVNSIAT